MDYTARLISKLFALFLFVIISRSQTVNKHLLYGEYPLDFQSRFDINDDGNDDCRVLPKNPNMREMVEQLIQNDYSVIILTFNLDNAVLNDTAQYDIYRPYEWIITDDDKGNGLLVLQENLRVISLTPLALGMKNLKIDVTQIPHNCLYDRNISEIEIILRNLILRNIHKQTRNLSEINVIKSENVCNMHIKAKNETLAYFYYKCCHIVEGSFAVCKDLQETMEMHILLKCISILALLLILFLPALIPKSIFPNNSNNNFTYKLPKPWNIIVKISSHDDRKDRFKTLNFDNAEYKFLEFSRTLKMLRKSGSYRMSVNEVTLRTENMLIKKGKTSIGIFCILQRKFKSIVDDENMPSALKFFMKISEFFLLLGIVFVPFALRTLTYFAVEKPENNDRMQATLERNLSFVTCDVQGVLPLLSFDDDDVGFFAFFSFSTFVLLYFKSIQNRLKALIVDYTLVQNPIHISSFCKKKTPFFSFQWDKYGFIRLLFLPVTGIFAVVCLVSSLPTINLLFRVIRTGPRFLVDSALMRFKDFKTLKLFFTIIVCVNFLYLAVLLTQIFLFVIALILYTIIGIILYASETFKFVSFTLFILLYIYRCFGGIQKKYSRFCTLLVNTLRLQWRKCQRNVHSGRTTAYSVKFDEASEECHCTFSFREGLLHCSIPSLVFFLDHKNREYIPKEIYEKTLVLPYPCCPGEPGKKYFYAALRFVGIMIFLGFVYLVIMAFEKGYEISAVNRMLATLITGLLPWLFENILLKKKDYFNSDNDVFNIEFERIVDNHKRIWTINDVNADSSSIKVDNYSNEADIIVIRNELEDNEMTPLIY